VTDPSTRSPGGRYRLRTFGPPTLLGAEAETILGHHGNHRRRLALLAVLGAAGERGRSRDQLLLLFWPDATQSRARHSLDQLLYALRGSLGESVFDGVNPVRLNARVVDSDVGAFNAAIERGDLKVAVGEYHGPFLDGFYLSDAPEFEQWAEAERARLAASYAGALERLAQDGAEAQDHATAVRWWRTLVESDPVSGKNAVGLIGALVNAGDHAAALQYAKRYEALVAQQLGVGAGAAVAALVEEVRAKARAEPPTAFALPPVTAQAVPGTTPIDHPSPQRSARRRSAPYVVGAMLAAILIAIGVSLRPMTRGSAAAAATESSIAVLPFANVSGTPQDATLVDGITEELIGRLAKLGHLRVTARTSAFAFKNSDLGVRRIADSLGVANIIEGSVQRIGSQLRVQVRLVDARDGSTRWSETYDRELRDVFVVQSEIAGAVARALDLQLGASTLAVIRRGSTPSIAAYELYLRGNDAALMRSDSGARVGLENFRQAIALDSSFAAAYAGLARMHMRIATGDDQELPRRDRLALAEQAALKAVALDDSLGEAHATLGLVRRSNYDLASAEAELTRAVALDPTNARVREWLVQLYVATDRPKEALAEARRARALDPLSPTTNAEVARALIANDRCDEALAQLDKLRFLRPRLLRAGSLAAQCYARKAMWPEAIAEMQRISLSAGPRGEAMLGYMLARAGRTDEARQILAAMLDRERRTDGGAFEVATVYAGLGENDQAFTWLDKSLEDRSLVFENATVVDGLRSDRRFDRFRRRLAGQ
jgi:TolB-like protein/DNA-binding SARP family transcriptional activator/tetratricopeptide (TPR) repeat protein